MSETTNQSQAAGRGKPPGTIPSTASSQLVDDLMRHIDDSVSAVRVDTIAEIDSRIHLARSAADTAAMEFRAERGGYAKGIRRLGDRLASVESKLTMSIDRADGLAGRVAALEVLHDELQEKYAEPKDPDAPISRPTLQPVAVVRTPEIEACMASARAIADEIQESVTDATPLMDPARNLASHVQELLTFVDGVDKEFGRYGAAMENYNKQLAEREAQVSELTQRVDVMSLVDRTNYDQVQIERKAHAEKLEASEALVSELQQKIDELREDVAMGTHADKVAFEYRGRRISELTAQNELLQKQLRDRRSNVTGLV